jgi:hypothetical protein
MLAVSRTQFALIRLGCYGWTIQPLIQLFLIFDNNQASKLYHFLKEIR